MRGVVNAAGVLMGRVPDDWELPEGSELRIVSAEEADAAELPPAYVPDAPAPGPVQLTPREFMSRLTMERQAEVTAAALGLVAAGNPGPMLWLLRLVASAYVDPDEPETADGVAAMEAAGLITAEEASALLAK